MFIEIPVYQADQTSANEIFHHEHIARIRDNGDVTVNPEAVDTASVKITFADGSELVALVGYLNFRARLTALTGIINYEGYLI